MTIHVSYGFRGLALIPVIIQSDSEVCCAQNPRDLELRTWSLGLGAGDFDLGTLTLGLYLGTWTQKAVVHNI